MADGGARSTSNFVNCAAYLLSTDTLQPLPLKKGDTILINFGLHDYNLGQAGVPECARARAAEPSAAWRSARGACFCCSVCDAVAAQRATPFSHGQSPPRCSSDRGARPAHRYAAEYKLGPSRAHSAPRSLRRALLMQYVNPGSRYRSGKRT